MLRITDIQNNRVDWPLVPGCQISMDEAQKYLLSPNDILIARTGGTIGKSFIVPNTPVKNGIRVILDSRHSAWVDRSSIPENVFGDAVVLEPVTTDVCRTANQTLMGRHLGGL